MDGEDEDETSLDGSKPWRAPAMACIDAGVQVVLALLPHPLTRSLASSLYVGSSIARRSRRREEGEGGGFSRPSSSGRGKGGGGEAATLGPFGRGKAGKARAQRRFVIG